MNAISRPFGPKPFDNLVRTRLQSWPQHPPGAPFPGRWLRGRPGADVTSQPYLKLPGSRNMRTIPDGLWLCFGPNPDDPYVDILCIEACSTTQNMFDKRARFAPSTCSLQVCCPLPWLLNDTEDQAVDGFPPGTPRWRIVDLHKSEPTQALILPVRDLRVIYGLRGKNYEGFARHQVAHGHEFFCPMEALTALDGHENPALRSLIARAAVSAAFMHHA